VEIADEREGDEDDDDNRYDEID